MEYSLTYRNVVDILSMIKSSEGCRSAKIEIGDFRLDIVAREALVSGASSSRLSPAAQPIQLVSSEQVDPPSSAAVREVRAPSAPTGGVVVKAPMLGTFYRALEPGAAPCVNVGDVIEAGATIGLIEVMKLFSPVTAAVAGRVVEIFVDNAALVEYDQPLIRVEPLS